MAKQTYSPPPPPPVRKAIAPTNAIAVGSFNKDGEIVDQDSGRFDNTDLRPTNSLDLRKEKRQMAYEQPFSTIAKNVTDNPLANKLGEYLDALSYGPTQVAGGMNRIASGGNVGEGATQMFKGAIMTPFVANPAAQGVMAGLKVTGDVSPSLAKTGNAIFSPTTTVGEKTGLTPEGGTPTTRSIDNIIQAVVGARGLKEASKIPGDTRPPAFSGAYDPLVSKMNREAYIRDRYIKDFQKIIPPNSDPALSRPVYPKEVQDAIEYNKKVASGEIAGPEKSVDLSTGKTGMVDLAEKTIPNLRETRKIAPKPLKSSKNLPAVAQAGTITQMAINKEMGANEPFIKKYANEQIVFDNGAKSTVSEAYDTWKWLNKMNDVNSYFKAPSEFEMKKLEANKPALAAHIQDLGKIKDAIYDVMEKNNVQGIRESRQRVADLIKYKSLLESQMPNIQADINLSGPGGIPVAHSKYIAAVRAVDSWWKDFANADKKFAKTFNLMRSGEHIPIDRPKYVKRNLVPKTDGPKLLMPRQGPNDPVFVNTSRGGVLVPPTPPLPPIVTTGEFPVKVPVEGPGQFTPPVNIQEPGTTLAGQQKLATELSKGSPFSISAEPVPPTDISQATVSPSTLSKVLPKKIEDLAQRLGTATNQEFDLRKLTPDQQSQLIRIMEEPVQKAETPGGEYPTTMDAELLKKYREFQDQNETINANVQNQDLPGVQKEALVEPVKPVETPTVEQKQPVAEQSPVSAIPEPITPEASPLEALRAEKRAIMDRGASEPRDRARLQQLMNEENVLAKASKGGILKTTPEIAKTRVKKK